MYGKIVKIASIQCKILYQLIQLLTLSFLFYRSFMQERGFSGLLPSYPRPARTTWHSATASYIWWQLLPHPLSCMRRCLSWDKPDLSPGEPCSFLPFPMLIRWTPRHAESILGRNTSMWRMWSWHLEQWEFIASEVLEPGYLDPISSSPI